MWGIKKKHEMVGEVPCNICAGWKRKENNKIKYKRFVVWSAFDPETKGPYHTQIWHYNECWLVFKNVVSSLTQFLMMYMHQIFFCRCEMKVPYRYLTKERSKNLNAINLINDVPTSLCRPWIQSKCLVRWMAKPNHNQKNLVNSQILAFIEVSAVSLLTFWAFFLFLW